jgi:hypothetical protein
MLLPSYLQLRAKLNAPTLLRPAQSAHLQRTSHVDAKAARHMNGSWRNNLHDATRDWASKIHEINVTARV